MYNPLKALDFVQNFYEAKLIMLRIGFPSIGSKKQTVRQLNQYFRLNQETEIVQLKTRTGSGNVTTLQNVIVILVVHMTPPHTARVTRVQYVNFGQNLTHSLSMVFMHFEVNV